MNEYNGTGEGWKRNRGKKPGTIDGTTLVETRRRSGMKYIGQAMNLNWTMNGGQGDIMAWRLPVEALNKQATKEARMAAIETQLAEEGFALIEAKKEPQEDMTNPANWKAGDLVKCISTECMDTERVEVGGVYPLLYHGVDDDGHVKTIHDGSYGIPGHNYEFHSRPQ